MKSVTVSSDKSPDGTFYRISQPGSPNNNVVICVHGIGSFHAHFDSLSEALAMKGFQVISYDLIGRGYSDYPADKSFDLDAHVNQLRKLLLHLNLASSSSRYHIIGHSMGGLVSAVYSSRFSSEVISLTLLAPAGLMDIGPLKTIRQVPFPFNKLIKHAVKAQQEKAWRRDFISHSGASLEIENEMVQRMKEVYKQNPKMYDAFWRTAMCFPLSNQEAIVKYVAASEVHVMLLWGDKDTGVPYEPSFERWKVILESEPKPNKRLEIKSYENLGHGFFMENPIMVNNDILHYLESL